MSVHPRCGHAHRLFPSWTYLASFPHSLAVGPVPAGVGRKGGTGSDCPSAAKGKGPNLDINHVNPLSKGWSGVECLSSLR